MEIRKKIWPEFFEKVASGEKKFELRLADFDVNKGDILVLEEWNPETKEYTGRKIEKKVGYFLKTKEIKFWTPEEIDNYGFLIVGFE
jgi:hypothetical protein